MSETSPVIIQVRKELDHQTKWRRIMSGCYFTTTALSILASGAATISSLELPAKVCGAFAACATILLALEHGLRFRDKWTHHRLMAARLKAVSVSFETHAFSEQEAALELKQILFDDAHLLPTANGARSN